jgi:hypothetical protein
VLRAESCLLIRLDIRAFYVGGSLCANVVMQRGIATLEQNNFLTSFFGVAGRMATS